MTNTPRLLAFPIAAYVATGVEITNAQGQAITSNVIACCSQYSKGNHIIATGIITIRIAITTIVGV